MVLQIIYICQFVRSSLEIRIRLNVFFRQMYNKSIGLKVYRLKVSFEIDAGGGGRLGHRVGTPELGDGPSLSTHLWGRQFEDV